MTQPGSHPGAPGEKPVQEEHGAVLRFEFGDESTCQEPDALSGQPSGAGDLLGRERGGLVDPYPAPSEQADPLQDLELGERVAAVVGAVSPHVSQKALLFQVPQLVPGQSRGPACDDQTYFAFRHDAPPCF